MENRAQCKTRRNHNKKKTNCLYFIVNLVFVIKIVKMSSGARPKDTGTKSKDAGAKQKKKGHYVSSRYMQASEEFSSLSSREKTDVSKSHRYGQDSLLSVTVSQDASRSCKTSTPVSKEDIMLPQLDASSVTSVEGPITIPHLKNRLGPVPASSVKRNLTKKYKSPDAMQPTLSVMEGSTYKGKKKVEKFNEKLAETELELMYATYLQAVFMHTKAREALEKRSSMAKETLYKINSLVLQLLHKYRSQQLSLKIMSSLIEIHDHCQKQENILRPIYDIIPEFAEKYKIMAEAVNITKHRLHFKDVVLPPPGSERDILTALQKISEMIKDFMEPKYIELISSADLLKSYVDTGEILTDALKRGLSLLTDAREECISEATLALSDI